MPPPPVLGVVGEGSHDYLEALEMVPTELCKLLLLLLRGPLHPADTKGLVGDDLVALEADTLLRLGVFDTICDDNHG